MAIFPRLELGIRRLELLWSVIAILVAIVLEPCAIYCYYLKSKFADEGSPSARHCRLDGFHTRRGRISADI